MIFRSIKNKLINFVCFYTRHFSNLRGTNRLSLWLFKNPFCFENINEVTITVRNVGILTLSPRDFVDKHIFIFNYYELEILKLLERILHESDSFIDVGANIGYFTLAASRLVSTSGHVFAFEPSPTVINRLKQNILNNGLTNITVFDFAVSDTIGKSKFYLNSDINSGMSSLRNVSGNKDIIVNTITLDSIIDQLPKIKLLKIDIEGAEEKALQGMIKVIQRDHPIIILELTNEFLSKMDSSSDKVLKFLHSYNYTTYEIQKTLKPIISPPLYQCNIICLQNNKMEEFTHILNKQ